MSRLLQAQTLNKVFTFKALAAPRASATNRTGDEFVERNMNGDEPNRFEMMDSLYFGRRSELLEKSLIPGAVSTAAS
jgi:hypothetical protein